MSIEYTVMRLIQSSWTKTTTTLLTLFRSLSKIWNFTRLTLKPLRLSWRGRKAKTAYEINTRTIYQINQHIYCGQSEHGYVIQNLSVEDPDLCSPPEWESSCSWEVKGWKPRSVRGSKSPERSDARIRLGWVTRQKCHQPCYFSPRKAERKHVRFYTRRRAVITVELREPQTRGYAYTINM